MQQGMDYDVHVVIALDVVQSNIAREVWLVGQII